MPAGAAILGFVAKEFGKKALWVLVDDFFPNKDTFEKRTAESLEQLNRKIDGIAQDAAFLRSQYVKNEYISHLTYLKKELIPYLILEAENTTHNIKTLTKHAKEVREHRIALQANFEQGMQVLNERVSACDFPLRTLFEILQAVAALRLVYLSWEYFLYRNLPDADTSQIKLIQNDYKEFKVYATQKISNAIEPICQARMDKISFFESHKVNLENKLSYVKYEYIDTFSSDYVGDPFHGKAISKKDETETKFFNISILGDIKDRMLVDTYTEMEKYRTECENHRKEVTRLNNLHVREPAQQFLPAINEIPVELPDAPLLPK